MSRAPRTLPAPAPALVVPPGTVAGALPGACDAQASSIQNTLHPICNTDLEMVESNGASLFRHRCEANSGGRERLQPRDRRDEGTRPNECQATASLTSFEFPEEPAMIDSSNCCRRCGVADSFPSIGTLRQIAPFSSGEISQLERTSAHAPSQQQDSQ